MYVLVSMYIYNGLLIVTTKKISHILFFIEKLSLFFFSYLIDS